MFSYLRGFQCFALSLLFVVSSHGFARPVALSQQISYSRFVQLSKKKLREVRELQKLWQWQERTHYDIYIGGSTLARLFRWVSTQLETRTPEQVEAMLSPALAELVQSDLDIFVPSPLLSKIKVHLPTDFEIDLISDTTYFGLVRAGGTTLESARMNPSSLDDPYAGVGHFYEGRLVFHWVDDVEFRPLYCATEGDMSKTVEALRYARFAAEFPELATDVESVEYIRQIAASESEFIRRSDRKAWIHYSVKKLWRATKEDPFIFLKTLRNFNLLQLLAEADLYLQGDFDTPALTAKLKDMGFANRELMWAHQLMRHRGGRFNQCLDYLRGLAARS